MSQAYDTIEFHFTWGFLRLGFLGTGQWPADLCVKWTLEIMYVYIYIFWREEQNMYVIRVLHGCHTVKI